MEFNPNNSRISLKRAEFNDIVMLAPEALEVVLAEGAPADVAHSAEDQLARHPGHGSVAQLQVRSWQWRSSWRHYGAVSSTNLHSLGSENIKH